MTDVSLEALQSIRAALQDFSNEVPNVLSRAVNTLISQDEYCRGQISSVKAQRDEALDIAQSYVKKAKEWEATASQAMSEANFQRARQQSEEQLAYRAEQEAQFLRAKAASIQIPDKPPEAAAQADAEKANLESQASAKESVAIGHRAAAEKAQARKNYFMEQYKKAMYAAQEARKQAKRYGQIASELERKLDWLESAFSDWKVSYEAYLLSARNFKRQASEEANVNGSALDRCIAEISRYLSINL